MAGRVRFLDESHSVIFTDKGIQFFSTRVETSPELVSQIPIEENIRSINICVRIRLALLQIMWKAAILTN